MDGQTAAKRIRGSQDRPTDTPVTLRAVEAMGRPRTELTGQVSDLPIDLTEALRLDAQARASARRLLSELGWDATTQLVAHTDPTQGLLWVQALEIGTPHDVDGSDCDCGRCTDATTGPPQLPGELREAFEQPSITGKGELNLTRGLLGITGTGPGETVLAFAVSSLHAVALANPQRAFDAMRGNNLAAPSADTGSATVTHLHARTETR